MNSGHHSRDLVGKSWTLPTQTVLKSNGHMYRCEFLLYRDVVVAVRSRTFCVESIKIKGNKIKTVDENLVNYWQIVWIFVRMVWRIKKAWNNERKERLKPSKWHVDLLGLKWLQKRIYLQLLFELEHSWFDKHTPNPQNVLNSKNRFGCSYTWRHRRS